MAQAKWVPAGEVRSTKYSGVNGGPQLLLQKGFYRFFDGSPDVHGYRFIWRKNGRLQSRPARIDDLAEIDALLSMAWNRGWT